MFAELARQPLRYYEAAFGVRHPYPKCDLVLVPAYPALAFSVPGLRSPEVGPLRLRDLDFLRLTLCGKI
jgi:hypothetical protein